MHSVNPTSTGAVLKKFGMEKCYPPTDIDLGDFPCPSANSEEIRDALEALIPVNGGIPLIRVGSAFDGGYLLPDDFQDIEACFSPGTNNFKDFEDQLVREHGIKSFMCDYSSDIAKLKTPIISGMQFFDKKWLDVEQSPFSLDINEWVAGNASPGSDLILQMDIEGAEYRNLIHASDETMFRFRMIVLELHDLNLLSNATFLYRVFKPALEKISKNFVCVHLHPNNCRRDFNFGVDIVVPQVVEVTFLRKDRIKAGKNAKKAAPIELPHRLDTSNALQLPPLDAKGVFLKNAEPIKSEINSLKLMNQYLLFMNSLHHRELMALKAKMASNH
jgi:hypothetical protein